MIAGSIQWGTVGEWVGGVGAIAAFIFAFVVWRSERDEKREAQEQARRSDLRSREAQALDQARKLGVDPHGITERGANAVVSRRAKLTNRGDQPFTDITLVLGQGDDATTESIDLLGPHSITSVAFLVAGHPHLDEVRSRPLTASFTDAQGNRWRMSSNMALTLDG